MTIDMPTAVVVFAAFFLMTFTKGAFGGGFGIIGIPFLALVMDPIVAGALIAPMNVISDVLALRYWRPTTWSKPDVALLAPALLIGMAFGFVLLKTVPRDVVTGAIAVIVLSFVVVWMRGTRQIKRADRSVVRGTLAGVASGFTSMTAHAGGPLVAMYLLPLGLPKSVYAGTTFIVFVGVNLIKSVPWVLLIELDRNYFIAAAIALPAVVLGLEVGWRLHNRINQFQLYNACYVLLTVVALKLLWDSLAGLI